MSKLPSLDQSLVEITFEDYAAELEQDFDELILEYFERTDPEQWKVWMEIGQYCDRDDEEQAAKVAYKRACMKFLRIVYLIFIEKIDAWLKAGGE
jgi:hypothetical protein